MALTIKGAQDNGNGLIELQVDEAGGVSAPVARDGRDVAPAPSASGASLIVDMADLGLNPGAANDGVLRRWNDSHNGLDVIDFSTSLPRARGVLGVLTPDGTKMVMFGAGAKAIINDGQGSSESFTAGATLYAAGDHMTTNAPNGGETCAVVGWTLVGSDDPDYDFNTASVPIFVRLLTPVTI